MKDWQLKILAGAIALLLMIALLSCNVRSRPTGAIPAVKNFDVLRYMGQWHEIARLPHSFEKDIVMVKADYTLQSNGTIKVVNSGLRNDQSVSVTGTARSCKAGIGELEVSFFRPFYGLYKIIYLNDDYTLAIVTGSTMDHLWILSRKKFISPRELAMCLDILKKNNFAVNLLQYPSGMVEKLCR